MAATASTILDCLGTATVKLLVGESKREVTLHKDLVCSVSPVLKTLFTSDFKEAQTQIPEHDNVDVRAFQLFVHWLYTGEVSKNVESITGCNKLDRDEVRVLFYLLADQWMLDDAVKKEILKQVLAERSQNGVWQSSDYERLPAQIVHLVYHSCGENDPMRLVILDICCRDMLQKKDTPWLMTATAGLEFADLQNLMVHLHDLGSHKQTVLRKGEPSVSYAARDLTTEMSMAAAAPSLEHRARYRIGFLNPSEPVIVSEETEALPGIDAGSDLAPDDGLASEDGEIGTDSPGPSVAAAFQCFGGATQQAPTIARGVKRSGDDNERDRDRERISGRGGRGGRGNGFKKPRY